MRAMTAFLYRLLHLFGWPARALDWFLKCSHGQRLTAECIACDIDRRLVDRHIQAHLQLDRGEGPLMSTLRHTCQCGAPAVSGVRYTDEDKSTFTMYWCENCEDVGEDT